MMSLNDGGAGTAASGLFKKKINAGLAVLLGTGFKSSKCKTELKLTTARIKLLRNRREAQIRMMRRDIAALLKSGQETTARIRVEHVIREEKTLQANDIIELFCELLVTRLSILTKQRDCPADLKEGISSLIFASPRCSEIPELLRIRDNFEKKYGKDFVSAAIDLRPNSSVNRTLIEKLSARTPTGEVKLKILKEIAKEYQVDWDVTDTEHELLKPSAELLDGPRSFGNSTTTPTKPVLASTTATMPVMPSSTATMPVMLSTTVPMQPEWKSTKIPNNNAVITAKAAMELAEKAVEIAHTAAQFLNNQTSSATQHFTGFVGTQEKQQQQRSSSVNSNSSNHSVTSTLPNRNFTDVSSDGDSYKPPLPPAAEEVRVDRRKKNNENNENLGNVDSVISFDKSDGFESSGCYGNEGGGGGFEFEDFESRPPLQSHNDFTASDEDRNTTDGLNVVEHGSNSRVHPKLPDYEKLTARFESLKLRRLS